MAGNTQGTNNASESCASFKLSRLYYGASFYILWKIPLKWEITNLKGKSFSESINKTSKWLLSQRSKQVMRNFQHNKAVNMNLNEQPDFKKKKKNSTFYLWSNHSPRKWCRHYHHCTVCPIVHLCLVSEYFLDNTEPISLLFTCNSLEEHRNVRKNGGTKNNLKVIRTLEAQSSSDNM